ncbi:hypothetical protein DB346_22265 [Verrucomicrobia bacterium LW23]|nr:hypothetical protein DB346_22265 [Verrucomicrobia bacterium LW23]
MLRLRKIRGISDGPVWHLRVLEIHGKDPVTPYLQEWSRFNREDFKRIIRVMERLSKYEKILDEKHVKQSATNKSIYEMRAHTGKARIMFFYVERCKPYNGRLIICTNVFEKGRGDQDKAFQRAETIFNHFNQEIKNLEDVD